MRVYYLSVGEKDRLRQVPDVVTGGINMKLTLKLNGLDDVKKFIDITSRHGENMSLKNGNYVVDAKSILGIFTMDLSQPVELVCDEDDTELMKELAPFIAV